MYAVYSIQYTVDSVTTCGSVGRTSGGDQIDTIILTNYTNDAYIFDTIYIPVGV
jgi:hypothetical protein